MLHHLSTHLSIRIWSVFLNLMSTPREAAMHKHGLVAAYQDKVNALETSQKMNDYAFCKDQTPCERQANRPILLGHGTSVLPGPKSDSHFASATQFWRHVGHVANLCEAAPASTAGGCRACLPIR